MRGVQAHVRHTGPVKMKRVLGLLIGCALIAGCDADRVSKLEKENADLKAKVDRQDAALNFDLQAKCSKDARVWFGENWSRDKDTALLDFTNHYNKLLNKCFILVELHSNETPAPSWWNDMTLTDIYENSRYGHYSEDHIINLNGKNLPVDRISDCEVYGNKCTSIAEFNNLTNSYMSN